MEKSIYELELHEMIVKPSGITILRVPGGWLYNAWNPSDNSARTATFVPYSDEHLNGDPVIKRQNESTRQKALLWFYHLESFMKHRIARDYGPPPLSDEKIVEAFTHYTEKL